MRLVVCAVLVALMAGGCASGPNSGGNHSPGYAGAAAWVADAVAGDGPGSQPPSAAPQPLQVENLPKSKRGNAPVYTVAGVRYGVLDNAEGFVEHGNASWYGRKFHGRETSSGEVYDMYQLTAAHKHLPLPTFVRVTRTDNGNSIVVKVNDRGPFVPGRVIDLSYQAAATLGIVGDGTAPVLVEALSSHLPAGTSVTAETDSPVDSFIEVPASNQAATENRKNLAHKNYLQLGAFSEASNAKSLAGDLWQTMPVPVVINHDPLESLFRVWVGPIRNLAERDAAVGALHAQGVSQFTMVTSTY